jgi:hypothetical protein
MDRPPTVAASGVEVRAAPEQFVDELQLAGHHGPVDGLVGALVTRV